MCYCAVRARVGVEVVKRDVRLVLELTVSCVGVIGDAVAAWAKQAT